MPKIGFSMVLMDFIVPISCVSHRKHKFQGTAYNGIDAFLLDRVKSGLSYDGISFSHINAFIPFQLCLKENDNAIRNIYANSTELGDYY